MSRFSTVIILLCSYAAGLGQKPYGYQDRVSNFSAGKIINNQAPGHDLATLKKEITVLDFFATWCVPCIKALPNLSAIQARFSKQLKVILISAESEQVLTRFLNQRASLPFPVVVDDDGKISALFQPPSFPYTVVLNSDNQVIAITEAASITDDLVNSWLRGHASSIKEANKTNPATILSVIPTKASMKSTNSVVALSQELVYASKTQAETGHSIESLKNLSYTELVSGLKNDDEKKAFWINIYNGYTQLLLQKSPEAYNNRGRFFKSKQLELAGKKFSLDDIEHGILRRSKNKWSLGYLGKIFTSKKEKDLRVERLDYRVHFALNCGAKSCPPIAYYDPSDVNRQLDVATAAYLTGEVVYNGDQKSVRLPAIMGWFRHDFGGKKKMVELVKSKGIIPQHINPSVKFNKYNWELHLSNFQN